MKGSLTTRKTTKRTGRGGYHTVNDFPTANSSVQSFVTEICSSPDSQSWFWTLISRPLAWKLYFQLESASRDGLKGSYFRARRFPEDKIRPAVSELGPPPLSKQGEGRYTCKNEVVLYLSRNSETAVLEIGLDESKPRIFVQQFELSFPDAKVLVLNRDLEETNPHLHYLLLNCEYLPGDSLSIHNPYRATQFLSYLCRLRGIAAIEYPSVRGGFGTNRDAVNLVIFGNAVGEAEKMTVGNPFEVKSES